MCNAVGNWAYTRCASGTVVRFFRPSDQVVTLLGNSSTRNTRNFENGEKWPQHDSQDSKHRMENTVYGTRHGTGMRVYVVHFVTARRFVTHSINRNPCYMRTLCVIKV